jgi:hypothetical protein
VTVVSPWLLDVAFAPLPQSGLAWFCFLLPSRPGGFRPEPLTDPCLTVSGHTARATRGRPAPSAETIGFLLLPVDPCRSRLGDPPPSLHENYPVSSLLRSSPPLFGTSVLSASRGFRLGLLPYHYRPGSQVPYESPDESHASYTPDIAWPVSRSLPCCSRSKRDTPVLMSSEFDFDALSEVRLHSSLSSLHDVIIVTLFNHNVHHRSFWLKPLMAV